MAASTRLVLWRNLGSLAGGASHRTGIATGPLLHYLACGLASDVHAPTWELRPSRLNGSSGHSRRRAGPTHEPVYISRRIYWIFRSNYLVDCLERSPGCGPLSCRRDICRSAAIAAWFLHLSAIKSSALLSYGVDNFTSIGLFYLMLSPLPDHLALDSRWRKWPPKNAQLESFWQRVLQLHLCVIYFFSGLTKLLGSGWWNGESLWRALTRPPFDIVPSEMLIRGKYLFIPLGLGICLLETSYPIFIWPRRTRLIWLVGVIAMHGAIAVLMVSIFSA